MRGRVAWQDERQSECSFWCCGRQNQYLPATRAEVGASSLPGGKDYYQACLKFHTSTNLTPQEVHNLGLKEVARVEEEVQKVRRQ